ncbi:MAG: replication initiator protein [Microviridae sp.]|nr:MAG: replication initiator protein [Microviridae sp.]
MACYHPISGYKSRTLTKNGKRKLTFSTKDGYVDLPLTVPCGQCIGCRIDRSRAWAMRLMHEAQSWEQKCFITLTYDDENLPYGKTLVKSHFQNFMKRLRKKHGGAIKYFHCGEYGTLDNRPHYHAILYGVDFPDRTLHSENHNGNTLWKSETLSQLWGKGFCLIGNVSYQSAAYTARYILKKVTGERASDHYQSVDPETGEIISRTPEYITASNRPGIASDWIEKYHADAFPSDFLVVAGKKHPVPRFYLKRLERDNKAMHDAIKIRRIRRASTKSAKADNTPERLAVREEIKISQINQLKRG